MASLLSETADSASKFFSQALSRALSEGLGGKSSSSFGLRALARTRSIVYTGESLMIPVIELLVNRKRPHLPSDDMAFFNVARNALNKVIEDDIDRIERGIYPAEVLRAEHILQHFRRFPVLFSEGLKASLRRKSKKARVFGEEAKDLLRGLPEYYQRNFHFQGDGYLSERSAELYEHQVEVLFAGSADAMRRMIIEPLREQFGPGDGEGLTFLEVGAGTGRATLFVRMAFPKAKIIAVDPSGPYLKKAQKQLEPYQRHGFFEALGEKLPFQDQTFDAVYSVFLFHELPREVRRQVIKEGHRVLKPGGFYGFVDSLQLGDTPELDSGLKQFPTQYHEPFYRDYIETPMTNLLTESGFAIASQGTGFFSKFVSAKKTT